MRGSRLGLVAVLSVGLFAAIAPDASANGLPLITPHLIAAPILIVIINYPLNGLMLYIVIRRGLNRGPVPMTWTEGRFLTDFAGTVLQFTLFGAIIDTAVFTHLNGGGMASALLVMGLGLLAVAATCALACHRSLWFEPHHTLLAMFIVLCVNMLGWYFVLWMFLHVFILVELPLIALLWVVLIWRVTVRGERLRRPMLEYGDGKPAVPAGLPAPIMPAFRPPASQMDITSRRMELRFINAVLLAVCVVLLLGIDVV